MVAFKQATREPPGGGGTESSHSLPKRPVSAFLLFANKRRAFLKQTHQKATSNDLSKILSQEWRALPTQEREEYKSLQARELALYREAMKPYRNPGKSKAVKSAQRTESSRTSAVREPAVADKVCSSSLITHQDSLEHDHSWDVSEQGIATALGPTPSSLLIPDPAPLSLSLQDVFSKKLSENSESSRQLLLQQMRDIMPRPLPPNWKSVCRIVQPIALEDDLVDPCLQSWEFLTRSEHQ